MENVIAVLLIVVILGSAIGYMIREKKRGSKCIACPFGKDCGANPNSNPNTINADTISCNCNSHKK